MSHIPTFKSSSNAVFSQTQLTLPLPIHDFLPEWYLAAGEKTENYCKTDSTAIDFAEVLRYTADELYSKTEKIILVTDNLNIHVTSSFYKTFSTEEANRLTKRFECHYTLKHGSWLDMAEIEIGVMSRQALAKPFPGLESFEEQVRNWTMNRNARCIKINWQCTTADTQIKLAKLYQTLL